MKNIKKFDEFMNEEKSYFDVEEGICPKCGFDKLEYDGGEEWNKDYTCTNCGFEGTEVYELDRMDIPKFQEHHDRFKYKRGSDAEVPPYDEGEDDSNFMD